MGRHDADEEQSMTEISESQLRPSIPLLSLDSNTSPDYEEIYVTFQRIGIFRMLGTEREVVTNRYHWLPRLEIV